MPGWHAFTQKYRDEGLLEVVGIATEQHPARTRLFAQWQGFDWPILWDPFNLTGSKAVPNHIFVDEFGIVRSTRPKQATFEDELLFADFGEAPTAAVPMEAGADALLETARHAQGSFEHAHYGALSDLLWQGDRDAAIEVLEAQAAERPGLPNLAFRAGVARRMRFDSEGSRPDDFQSAVDHWTAALSGDPSQYIWRRRIQQYGPRMDKPYNFYSWIETARSELIARGETPVELAATLTPAELAEPRGGSQAEDGAAPEPDPESSVPRDETGLISIETAVAFDTSKDRSTASVHLALRPNAELDAHWNHEVDALVVWLDVAEGLLPVRLLADPPRSDVATSDELRTLSFEVRVPDGAQELTLAAYALYYVCAGEEGTCQYLRRDFEVHVKRP